MPGATAKTPVEIDAANLKWNDAEHGDLRRRGRGDARRGDAARHAPARLSRQGSSQDAARAVGKDGKPVPAAAPGPLGAAGSADIRRIEADGPVTVVQKDQIGAGARGEYDKAKDRIVLDGDVVLTQGPNATAGGRLVYRVATRDVTIFGAPRVRSQFVQQQAAPAAPSRAAAPRRRTPPFPAPAPREPIQIEANQLQWFDAPQRPSTAAR
ncbi:MAG: hypothetical protein HZY79_01435 [Rhodoblastus sp.]|nr:MAG: hypothetical protein HZY79_01435 [Rhodoblastus sp.]